jgi:glycine hydroxymethyltransferase
VRLGTPAGTTRGFGPVEWRDIGTWIGEVLDGLRTSPDDNSAVENSVRARVTDLCRRFPIYSDIKK